MFCPTNETFQNLTEKTKLLAQKCTQQIRVATQQHINNNCNNISGSNNNNNNQLLIQQQQQEQQQQQQENPQQLQHNEQAECQRQVLKGEQQTQKIHNNSICENEKHQQQQISQTDSVKRNFKYLCSCTGGTLRSLTRRHKENPPPTVKWYVKQPTWRLWGEEREKDAIFTVYLKKVRYHRPIPSANQDSDDEISHLEWETVRVRFVKAATLSRLVEALATDDGELESTFINVFFSTYRTFSNPKEVLELLIKRYETLCELVTCEEKKENLEGVSKLEQHKKTLVSALHVWLDGFPEDWNEENLRNILGFTSRYLPHSELYTKILSRLERILRLASQQQQQQQQQHNHYGLHPAREQQQIYNKSTISSLSSSFSNNSNSSSSSTSNYGSSISEFPSGPGVTWMQQSHHPPSQHLCYQTAELAEQFVGLCLAPALRGPQTHLIHAYRFPHIPFKHFAEQLTRMDAELFRRLIPHQCLGATWAKRDKNEAETVVATVTQFNAVSYRVISSILIEPKLKPQERALHIAAWIDIGQELRLLKNFSSLKAIISGLQSNAIYRLSKTWAALPKEKMEIFTELARIFSEDNNAWAQREVLMREGTAKFADTAGENDRHLQKVFQKQNTQTSHGTIPYLGTFLTDLTMIHAAIPDTIGDSLINFDKKRKEFEVLAQIKLLQGAANAYNLRDDHHFNRWFASMLVLDEREAHTISCQLESPPEPIGKKLNSTISNLNNNVNNSSNNFNNQHYQSNGGNNGHRKTDSITSNSSSGAGSQLYCEINTNTSTTSSISGHSSRHNSLDRDALTPLNPSIISASSSSMSNLSLDSNNSSGQKSSSINLKQQQLGNGKLSSPHLSSTTNNASVQQQSGMPLINAQLVQNSPLKNSSPDFYIIRVTYETDNVEQDGIVLYKSIMLGNNERTPQVIRNAMMKLDLEGDPDRYTLAQVLPDKELVMPPNANVYYAVNTAYNLNFILRPKRNDNSGQ